MHISWWVIYYAIGVVLFLPAISKEMVEDVRSFAKESMDLIPSGERLFVISLYIAVIVSPLFWPTVLISAWRRS